MVHCAQVIDDMVFAIGGFNGVTTIFNVECYDPQADEWLVVVVVLLITLTLKSPPPV